ncbi:MAG: thioredoxin family protein [Planctomycetaceae bacterium]|nr:thioredoxin family protein [Planctomycetaceae bacterium]
MRTILVTVSVVFFLSSSLVAQDEQVPELFKLEQPGLDLDLNLGSGKTKKSGSKAEPEFTSTLEAPENSKPGDVVTMKLHLTIPPGSHTYSQSRKFSGRTVISLSEVSGAVPVDDAFLPDHEPKAVFEPLFEQEVEKFKQEVTWSRKYRLLPNNSEAKFSGKIRYQVCNDDNCIPYSNEIQHSLAVDSSAVPSDLVSYSVHGRPLVLGKPGPSAFTIAFSPIDAAPGDEVTLSVRLDLDAGWHAYAQSQEEGPGGTPTEFLLESFQGLVALDENFVPNVEPEIKQNEPAKGISFEQHLFDGSVTWTRKFLVDESADQNSFGIQGAIIYQTCTDQKCLPPQEQRFALGQLSAAQPISAMKTVEPIEFGEFEMEEESAGLGWYLVYAFLGGLILNVMPCVLPVLAIKILSFVKQAGENRARIFQLNLSYSLGVIAVFLSLAALAAFLEMGWGSLFQKAEFNIFMACLVFVMGLSLLGVFEIPIPGLAAGGTQKEGLTGAFLTGIFATFLATPCSGPLMGATLGWSVKQETHIIFLIWGVMGLGMASPYLLAGIFPSTIKWLPKPGAWMIRFKEISGFALMGAVIWIISYTGSELIIPVMIMMMGLAFGLWMVGNLYDSTTHIVHKNRVRILAACVTSGIVYFGISQMPSNANSVVTTEPTSSPTQKSLAGTSKSPQENTTSKHKASQRDHGEHGLPWRDFTDSTLQSALRQKKTVLVDFTADWCLVCKQNERNALNTEETQALVNQEGIVPLYADFTNEDPHLKAWLKKFDSISVPLTVIFPGDNPQKPIVIRDKYSQSYLLEKLREATAASQTAKIPQTSKLPWRDFSDQELQAALNNQKTVLLHFGADWNLLAKQPEYSVLNTAETLKLVKEKGIVPLYADFSNEDPHLKAWLKKFDSISVPLTVIFPGDNPQKPIVIRDKYSQGTLLEKLKEATASSKTAMAD